MRRREFLKAFGVAATLPRMVLAEETRRTTLGVLLIQSENNPEQRAWFAAFREELTRLVSSEGRALRLEQRWADADIGKAKIYAAELVALKPDVIFAFSTPAVAALRAETVSIPIVFVGVSDPVGAKFVISFSRPGGNITGFVQNEQRLGGKWLSLLKQAAPNIARAAMMCNPDTAPGHGDYFFNSFETAAKTLEVTPRFAPVRSEEDIRDLIKSVGDEGGGVVISDDGFMAEKSRIVIAEAMRAGVPTIAGISTAPTEGGLLAYHSDMAALFRSAAGYVHRIFGGETPADLPVQTPVKYQLIVNLRVASTLHLPMPQTLLAAADDVIE